MKRQTNRREEILENIQKIVVKVGTSTLTKEDGNLNIEKIKKIVAELSNLSNKGYDVVLVTSGAVGAGMGKLNMTERPKTLSEKQALASVGQVALTHLYQLLFQEYGKIIGQILLTRGDFSDRRRYLNARNVCNTLLKNKIIPVINENDAVVSNELKVGDNDTLSALVSGLIDADLLIILSDVQGLYNKNPQKYEDANLIEIVGKIDDDIKKTAGGEGSKFGTGGMITKIIAAEMATKIGTNMVIASGDDPKNISRIVEKENIGTAKATINGSHANGLNYVPFDGYIAELHKGERVLTKDENESIFGSLRNRLQNATQSSKSENSTSSEKPITYQIYNSFTFNGVSEDTKNSIIENLQEKLNELQRQLEKMKEERETYARTSL